MVFKLYDCDIGLTIRGQSYDFEHVDSVVVEDPVRNKLIRGANAGNKMGLVYQEGNKEPKTVTTSVIGFTPEFHALLKDVFKTQERIDFWCISRQDGSCKMAKNAILSQEPQQLNIDDSAESLNTALVFESFDVGDNLKS